MNIKFTDMTTEVKRVLRSTKDAFAAQTAAEASTLGYTLTFAVGCERPITGATAQQVVEYLETVQAALATFKNDEKLILSLTIDDDNNFSSKLWKDVLVNYESSKKLEAPVLPIKGKVKGG